MFAKRSPTASGRLHTVTPRSADPCTSVNQRVDIFSLPSGFLSSPQVMLGISSGMATMTTSSDDSKIWLLKKLKHLICAEVISSHVKEPVPRNLGNISIANTFFL